MKLRLVNSNRGWNLQDATSIRGALRILGKEEKKQKALPEPEPEATFSWFKDQNYLDMEIGIKAIENIIQILKETNHDKGVANYIMEMLRKSLNNILKSLDDILGVEQ